jgi:hypothetical protein
LQYTHFIIGFQVLFVFVFIIDFPAYIRLGAEEATGGTQAEAAGQAVFFKRQLMEQQRVLRRGRSLEEALQRSY